MWSLQYIATNLPWTVCPGGREYVKPAWLLLSVRNCGWGTQNETIAVVAWHWLDWNWNDSDRRLRTHGRPDNRRKRDRRFGSNWDRALGVGGREEVISVVSPWSVTGS